MKTGPRLAPELGPSGADELLCRLRLRLVVGLVLTGLLLGGLVATFLYFSHARQLEQTFFHNVELQGLALESKLDRLRDIAAQITSRTGIRQELERYRDGLISRAELAAFSRPKLTDAMLQTEDVVGISRLDPEGGMLVEVGEKIPREFWPELPQAPDIRIGIPRSLAQEKRLVLSAPITDEGGHFLGTDLVLFDAAGIDVLLKRFFQRHPAGGVAVLAAVAKGRVYRFAAQGLEPGNRFLRALVDKEVREALRQPGEEVRLHDHAAGEMVGFQRKIDSAGWVLLCLVPAAQFYAPAMGYAAYAGAAVMALALFGAFLSLLLVRPLARRISAEHGSLQRLLEENGRLLEQVRTSEEKFRSLVETSRDWFWEVDAEGRYIYVSPRCRELLGYEPEELVGATPFDLMAAEEAERVRRMFTQILARRAPIENLENVNLPGAAHLRERARALRRLRSDRRRQRQLPHPLPGERCGRPRGQAPRLWRDPPFRRAGRGLPPPGRPLLPLPVSQAAQAGERAQLRPGGCLRRAARGRRQPDGHRGAQGVAGDRATAFGPAAPLRRARGRVPRAPGRA
jgi:PAS domain S-box-containing protein